VTAPRLTRARSLLAEWGLDALLVHQAANRTYLSGFTGSAGIALITTLEALLLVDFRYTEQAASEAPEFEVIKADRQFIETLTEVVRGRGLRRVGFESESVTVKQHHDYADRLAPAELIRFSQTLDLAKFAGDLLPLLRSSLRAPPKIAAATSPTTPATR